jgi:type IV secretion system protein VirB6
MFLDYFNVIDGFLDTWLAGALPAMISALGPIGILAATFAIMLVGFRFLTGGGSDPAYLMEKVFRLGIPFAIGLSLATYNGMIVNWLSDAPGALLGTVTQTGEVNIGAILDDMLQAGIDASVPFMEEMSLFDRASMAIGLMGFLMWLSTLALVVGGSALILVSKFILIILLSLGPLAVLCVASPSTQKFFEAWLGQTLNLGLLQFITGLLISLQRDVVLGTSADIMARGIGTNTASMFVIMALLVAISLLAGWVVASAMAGGAALGTMGVAGKVWRGSKSAVGEAGEHLSPRGHLRDQRRVAMNIRAARTIGRQWGAAGGSVARAVAMPAATLATLASRARPANANAPRTTATYQPRRTGTSP